MKVKEEVEEWRGEEEEEQAQQQEQQQAQQEEQDPSFGSSSIDVGSSSSSRSRLLGGGGGGNASGGTGDEGGDTVVACEACGADNARWYCAADDAYLCHRCDQSVHAANAVALRHERTSCFREEYATTKEEEDAGRGRSSSSGRSNSKRRREGWCKRNKTIKLEGHHVHLRTNGDGGDDEGDELELELEQDEEEEEEAHKVPVFQPDKQQRVVAGEDQSPDSGIVDYDDEAAAPVAAAPVVAEDGEVVDVERFLNSAAEYADDCCDGGGGGDGGLAALDGGGGGGLDLDFLGFGGQQLQFFDEEFAIRRDNVPSPFVVKGEPGGGDGFDAPPPPPPPPPLFAPPPPPAMAKFDDGNEHEPMWRQMLENHAQRRIWLRLDYDEVLNAWHGRRPFMDQQQQRGTTTTATTTTTTRGKRQLKAPVVPEDSSASDLAGSSDAGVVPELSSGSAGGDEQQQGRVPVVAAAAAGEGGREARVSRYREKRRTRLFSKKIRYEVRKLNAERRPRLKGRFIKRSLGN